MNSTENNKNQPRKRRNLTAEKKYGILEEIRSSPDKKGEILRREGIYNSDFARFAQKAREGAIKELSIAKPRKKGAEEIPLEEYKRLKRELEQKGKALADLSVDFYILKKSEWCEVLLRTRSPVLSLPLTSY